jgi:cyclic pyranopterin phosphate synthase
MSSQKLTHLDPQGRARMVDVGHKPETERTAVARGEVQMLPETLRLVREGNLKKGDLVATAELAGVMAAKKTHDLIPLCHPLPIHHISVAIEFDDDLPGVTITAKVRTSGKTGVEMEALTAVSVASLTVYDMAKAVDRRMVIDEIRLEEKTGGRSGTFRREAESTGLERAEGD